MSINLIIINFILVVYIFVNILQRKLAISYSLIGFSHIILTLLALSLPSSILKRI